MKADLWKIGVAHDRRPEGNFRHSQVIGTYGPGALVDLVQGSAIISGLAWWARGPEISEDRLTAMISRQEGYENIVLFGPPVSTRDLDDRDRKWIKAFRFPEWFVCQNEDCWADGDYPARADGARPRRLLRINQLDGSGHKCKGKGATSRVQAIRFVRACRAGHVDDIDWIRLVHTVHTNCKRNILWFDEVGTGGDLKDLRVTCSGCGDNIRMSVAAQYFREKEPTLGYCTGRRPWLGGNSHAGCDEPMRLLLCSASHAYFPVPASVIHIPDPDADIRNKVSGVYELIKNVKNPAQIGMLRDMQDPVRIGLEGVSDDAAYGEVDRRKESRPIARKKVKEAEVEVLQSCPPSLATDRPNGRFYARTLPLPANRPKVMEHIDKVVLMHRLTEVRAFVGFTRFEAKTTDVDGELDIGAEVARPDAPMTWLPAVENHGEGFFFSIKEQALAKWEDQPAVDKRGKLFRKGFDIWQAQREERKRQKPDFATARFVLLHSLSHLLISAVSLECGYAASSGARTALFQRPCLLRTCPGPRAGRLRPIPGRRLLPRLPAHLGAILRTDEHVP
ncbi:MAG: DrmB family protein [Polyangiaceae bacterium]|nr:DrmB family protein [Polyangiaceae bacterium]